MKDILGNIAWNFDQDKIKSIDDFNKEIKQYQIDIKEEDIWNSSDMVVEGPTVDIQYMVWVKGRQEIGENETLIDDDEDFDEGEAEDGMYQVEIVCRLKADNGKNFTALELMYKLHKQMQTKYLGDHTFFEGLTADDNEADENVPFFHMDCGS